MLVAAGSLYLLMGEPADAADAARLRASSSWPSPSSRSGAPSARWKRCETSRARGRSSSAMACSGASPGREVVPGDFVVLAEGDRVPADGLLRRAHQPLDGRVAADRRVGSRQEDPIGRRPGARPARWRRSALGVLRHPGHRRPRHRRDCGHGVRSRSSARSARRSQQVEPEPTPLQKETGRLVRTFAIVGLLACALVVVVFALTRGGGADVWKQGFLAGIAMAMATLPEEFPVVLTVFLALGAWRISRSHVLTRRMPAVEMLGAATVLCVDKTGTLTQNQMTLRQLAGSRQRPRPRDASWHAPGGTARPPRARDPGQQARSVRPDGAGAARGRRPAHQGHGAPASGLVADSRVPADARPAGREPRVAHRERR